MRGNIALAALVATALTARPGVFTDPRDGERYPLVEIAGMTWLGRNLNHAAAGSYCLDDKAESCTAFGRLYPWPLAMRACPTGFHLSTAEEWRRLESHLGMKAEEIGGLKGRGEGIGDKLKVGGSSGLEFVFSGWRRPDGSFRVGNGSDRAAALWTASEAQPDTAWHRDISSARSVIWRSDVDKPYSLSVRCVRDPR